MRHTRSSTPGRSRRAWPPITCHICLLALLHAAVGCAATPSPGRVVYESDDRLVRLEVTERARQVAHSHPATIAQSDLARLLEQVRAYPRTISNQPIDANAAPPTNFNQPMEGYAAPPTKAEDARAFSDEMVSFLSLHVSESLRKATPLEEVVFYLDIPRNQAVREITSGSAYVQDNNLHVLLANYRHATIHTVDLQEVRAEPLQPLGVPAYDLDPGPHGKLKPSSGFRSFVTAVPEHFVFPDLDSAGRTTDKSRSVQPNDHSDTTPSAQGR